MPLTRARKEILRAKGYDVHVVGAPSPGLRDIYHALLRAPWWGTLLTIVGVYLGLNVIFAIFYAWSDGVANAHPGFLDAFFFSVQTMGTIGYGSMYPQTRLANTLVVVESVVGLVVTALATGLVFARFSQVRPRVVFASRAAVGPLDGVPMLMVRVGNERRNRIVNTTFRMTLMRTTRTAEGVIMYRASDVPLVRGRAPALARSWTILHSIDSASPLYGQSPESLLRDEIELTVEVAGTDDTSLQPVHAIYVYSADSLVFGARLADVLSDTPDGNILLDLGQFHELVPTEPIEGFPYPQKTARGDDL
jgi:inward rectifier potassium channel